MVSSTLDWSQANSETECSGVNITGEDISGNNFEENRENELEKIDPTAQPDVESSVELKGSKSAESAVSLCTIPNAVNYTKKLVWKGKVVMPGIEKFTARAFVISHLTASLGKVGTCMLTSSYHY